jgi:hypothetical protein
MTNRISVIVMTVVGDVPRHREPPWSDVSSVPAPPGFCWRFVPEGPFAVQFRSILRMDARAVVVWVGADDAIDRAAKLIGRFSEAGLSIVIAIAEVHDPSSESVLRQLGALYLCANEAQQRLGDVLESILGPPSRSTDMQTVVSAREVKMDTG